MTKKKILFLHGALGAASNFKPLMELCSPQYECIAIDFPGHGNQQADRDYSIENFTDFLISTISRDFDSPVSVFGYSMGGYIALNALTRKAELFQKVMTLGTKFNWDEEEGRKQIAMLNTDKISEKIPHYAHYLAQLHPAHNWKDVVNSTCGLLEKLSANPPLQMAAFAEIEPPVCVGIGDRDNMVTPEETIAVYKQCKQGSMYIIPRMPHPIEKINTTLMLGNITAFF